MNTRTLGSELLRARKSKKLRQQDVADAVEVDRRRVSDWEKDDYHPGKGHRIKLANILDLSPRLLDKLYVPPAKPYGGIADLFEIKKPDYQPTGSESTSRKLLSLWREDKPQFNKSWDALNARPDRAEVRRFFLDVQSDAKGEDRAWMWLLEEEDHDPARLAPLRCGFRILPVVNPDTEAVVGDCPVPAIVRKGPMPGVIFIQNSVLTKKGVARPDAIVGVKINGHMHWCAGEFDGEGHDSRDDAFRPEQLRMPVARFNVHEVRQRNFAQLFWQRVHKALEI